MRITKILTSVVLSAALAWVGIRLSREQLPKLKAAFPTPQQVAVVALAAVAEAQDASRTHGPVAQAPEDAVPAPIADGPAQPEPVAKTGSIASGEALPAKTAGIEFEAADLLSGIQQGVIEATLRGNGRDRMAVTLRNNSPTPMRVAISAGQVFESVRNRVVLLRGAEVELMPAKSAALNLATAALLSSNTVRDAVYRASYQTADRVDALLKWGAGHPELSTAAMQTAVLALTENLPLHAVAKFAPVNPPATKLDTNAFRVETGDILAALTALRECGTGMESVALTVDPQLRIEAMIEPLSREAAKRFYGITEEREWDFWKRELLEGNPSTRHYALFGIARFYPDIALEMLPKWVREPQTHTVYRLAAIQALADTQRPEALPILRQLADEIGTQTDLGRTAAQAAHFLDKRLSELAARSQVVAFRGAARVGGF